MKKNIEMINTQKSTINWTYNILNNELKKPEGVTEIINGFDELLSGKCSSVMIGCNVEKDEIINDNNVIISVNGLTINIVTRKITRDDEEIYLTPKEFDILYFLAKNRGEVFTKEQIYQAVWDDEYLLDDSNIMAFIRKIRKKIEPNPDSPIYILTIWGIGYKFSD